MMEASVLGRSWTPGLREGIWQGGSGRRARHNGGIVHRGGPGVEAVLSAVPQGGPEWRNNSRAVAGKEQVGDTRGGMRTLMGGHA